MTSPLSASAAIDTAAPHPVTPLLLAAVALTGSLAFIHVYSLQSILPIIRSSFQASVVEAGNTVGATVLGVALMSPFTGMLSDALGRKKIIVASVLFMALPTLLLALAQNITQMLVLRFLQGVAVPGITVVLIAYLGEEFSGRTRVRLMSLYVSGTVFGGFIGRFLLGYLTEFISWRGAFALMALFSLGGGVWVARQLPDSRFFVANPNVSGSLNMLARHLRNRHVLSACALGFCVLFSLVGCFTYINLHLAAPPYHLGSAQLADIFAVYLIGMVITPVAGRLIVRFGANRTVLLAVTLSVSGVLLTLLPPLWVIVTALAMMSTGVFITQSATINYIAAGVNEGRSLASGLYYMSYYSGGFAGSWLCGYAFAHGSWSATVHVLVAAQVCAMAIAGVLMVKKSA